MRRCALAGALAALVAASCSPSPPLTLDTEAPSARSGSLDADGPLQGEIVGGHACFWVTATDGGVVSLVWPEASVARDNPLRVEDSNGRVIATVGDDPSSLSGNPTTEPGCRADSTRFIVG
ncbi:MAG: hypothetical protein Q4D79_13635 [Propionibacteriaceae bacterium]|nr:hypothetical protein [Propionibacteriaceae bacterium]